MINNKTENNPKNKNSKLISLIGIFLILLISGIYFAWTNIQANNRNEKFNSELEEILSKNSNQSETKISVDGSYGSLIILTELSDSPFELTDGLSSSDKIFYQQTLLDLNQFICLNYEAKRADLIKQYSQDETYQKDTKFINSQNNSPTCKVETTKNTYEYFTDENGERVITINGERYSSSDTSPAEIYGYGNPSPALRELMNKNNANLNAKEVQYNMKNSVGKNFGLEGTAELCDYYNWGYDDSIESEYFCMEVTPNGGTYSDHWYIYSHRDSFDKLYRDLLAGQVDIQMIGRIDTKYFEEHQENQATLVSAQWRK
jgi:hypothetical protein